jgi:stage V sporulation protein G
MEITEVRVKLINSQSDRVRAFCSITFDREFVVRDIKVIEGTNGLFVAMPSRKMADHCPKCKAKNHLRARYCNECGAQLRPNRAQKNNAGRSKLHADIAHPINMACRERLQKAILEAYQAESEKSKQPGYKPVELDEEEYDSGAEYASLIAELKGQREGERREERTGDFQEAGEGAPEDAQESDHGIAPEEAAVEAKTRHESGPQPAKSSQGHEFGKGIL